MFAETVVLPVTDPMSVVALVAVTVVDPVVEKILEPAREPPEQEDPEERQIFPEPDTAAASAVATPVPKPDMPVLTGSPVMLVATPDAGVPNAGVTKVGDVANTNAPDPVSSVIALAKFAEDGVTRKVAIPVPSPEIPVDTGRPVRFVATPLAGVPSAGVTNVGEVPKTRAPLPVSSVTAVARLALDGVIRKVPTLAPKLERPATGKPVALVSVALVGVPSIGVTNVGLVTRATFPVPLNPTNVITP